MMNFTYVQTFILARRILEKKFMVVVCTVHKNKSAYSQLIRCYLRYSIYSIITSLCMWWGRYLKQGRGDLKAKHEIPLLPYSYGQLIFGERAYVQREHCVNVG